MLRSKIRPPTCATMEDASIRKPAARHEEVGLQSITDGVPPCSTAPSPHGRYGSRRVVANGLDIVAVRIDYERPVIVGVIFLSHPRGTVVAPAGS